MARPKGIKNGMTTKLKKTCLICGKTWLMNPSQPIGKYCSPQCRYKSMEGSNGHWLGKKRYHMMGDKHPMWRGGKETYNERRRKSYPKHKHKIALWHKIRRFREGGKLSIATIQMLYEDNIKRYGTLTCYLCEQHIIFGKDCIEHKIPLSRGGNNEYNNLGVADQNCNSRKKDKTVEEYLIWREGR